MAQLEDLPPELLRRILESLLPQGLVFSFEYDEGDWTLLAQRGQHARVSVVGARSAEWCDVCDSYPCTESDQIDDMSRGVFYVNRAMASEARGTFFARNIFALEISAQFDHPKAFKATLGPLGTRLQQHIFREIKRIELTVEISRYPTPASSRLRARVRYFVDALLHYADDNNRRTLLQNLSLRVLAPTTRQYPHLGPYMTQDIFERHMFAVECLANITGVTIVSVSGLPTWFAQCLEMRIRGEGGGLKSLLWPTRMTVPKNRRLKPREVTTRASWQAVFDWQDFASRNGIELPEDAVRFFPPAGEADA